MTPVHPSTDSKFVFYSQVWELVCKIPPGKVATYGQIAGKLEPPPGISVQAYRAFGPRWVGSAMAACPEDVPWQRVVNSKGQISKRKHGKSSGQKNLLISEGVFFSPTDKIDLSMYQWKFDDSKEK